MNHINVHSIRRICHIASATVLVACLASTMAAPVKLLPRVSSEAVVDSEDVPKHIPDSTSLDSRAGQSIPYPAGALYIRRGICGAFLGGKHRNMGEQQSLYQWQGEVGYFYTPWFSGGVGFRIKAGEPSDTKQKILNRYFLLTRFHKAWTKTAIYIGPQLGLDNLNVLNGSPTGTDSIIQVPIRNTNASLGLDIGGGWKFSRWVGLTLGSNLEYSLVGEEGLPNNNSLNIHVNPGLALNILAFTDHLRNLVPAMYVNVEFQAGFLLLEKNRHRNDQAAVLGIGFAF